MIPLLFAAAAGSALKGFAGIAGGFQQSAGLKAQQRAAENEGKNALIRRTQGQVASREAMATTLGNILGTRTTRGASADSPTGQMIERQTTSDFYRQEAVAAWAEQQRAGAARDAARGFGSAARWAIPMAVLNSAGDFASAASYGRQAFAAPKPKGK